MNSLIVSLIVLSSISLACARQAEMPTQRDVATPTIRAVTDLRGVAPLPLSRERRAAFESFVAGALAKCGVPGASIAVVQNGAVVLLRGFGVREVGRHAPVTPDTLMGVGSVTKPVTATLVAALVDAGFVDWTTPVVDLLPEFALSDPVVTARVTLADLLSAASGLPRRDAELSFEADAYSPRVLIQAVKALPLVSPLGKRFHYSNQAVALGGYAAAAADGAAPNDLLAGYLVAVQHRVLNPIGMTRSTFRLADVLRDGDYAVPHGADLVGEPAPIPLLVDSRFVTAVAPAGALWSSARDMAKFLQTELDRGVAPDGTVVVSRESLLRTWQPGVAVPPDPAIPPAISEGLAHYGLGWYVGDYRGLTLISHSGGTYGFSSEIALLPEADLGIVVLTNQAGCGALVAFAAQYRLFELVFDQEPATEREFDTFLGAIKAQRAAAAIALGSIDPSSVAPLLGQFSHPALGDIELRWQDGAFVVDAGEVHSRLLPLRFGEGASSQYVMIDPPLSGASAAFTFEHDRAGTWRPVLAIQGEPEEAPVVYAFVPLTSAEDPSRATPAA